jgi:Domain of unknown function (DUF6456)
MSALVVRRDADGLPADPAVRTCLRMLAQRGARLVMFANGAAVQAMRRGAVQSTAWIEATAVPAFDAAGWLTDIGDGRYILSPMGRNLVRLMKAAPAPAAGIAAAAPDVRPTAGTTMRPTRAADGALAWLRAHRDKDGKPYLSPQAFAAAERLRETFHRAGMNPRVTLNWSAVARSRDESRGMAGSAREVSDGTASAQDRVRRALAAVPPELVGLVLDICCFDRRLQEAESIHGMPQRSGHFLLALALNALARHYGLLPPADGHWQPRGGMRHWGTEGYRPKV